MGLSLMGFSLMKFSRGGPEGAVRPRYRMTLPAAMVFGALSLLLAPAPGRAQDEPLEFPGAFRESVEVRWVLVPVVVREGARHVADLTQADFRLFVDGQPVAIESFESSAEENVRLHLLQDLSGSIANSGKLELSRELGRCVLRHAVPGDEFAIATFSSGRVRTEVPFTPDVERLRASLARWQPYGTTALHDAVAWLPELDPEGWGRRTVLLVTDGDDNASRMPPDQARELVRRADLPVYVLGLEAGLAATNGYAAGIGAGTGAGATASDEQVLHRLARETGGRFFTAGDEAQVAAGCAAVLADLRHRYVLSFPVQGGSGSGERYREIRVEVLGEGRQVQHRQGYTGGPPAG